MSMVRSTNPTPLQLLQNKIGLLLEGTKVELYPRLTRAL